MKNNALIVTTLALAVAVLLPSARVFAHCDSVHGPVVTAGRAALETGDVTPLLKWVTAGDEADLRSTLARARVVRGQGAEAKALADQYFLEALVRVHRAGEGMPFTGIKHDAGESAPVVTAGDRALADDEVEPLVALVTERIAREIRSRFRAAAEAHWHQDDSVAAGRTFVRAYVEFLHYVERIHEATRPGAADPHDAGHAGATGAAGRAGGAGIAGR